MGDFVSSRRKGDAMGGHGCPEPTLRFTARPPNATPPHPHSRPCRRFPLHRCASCEGGRLGRAQPPRATPAGRWPCRIPHRPPRPVCPTRHAHPSSASLRPAAVTTLLAFGALTGCPISADPARPLPAPGAGRSHDPPPPCASSPVPPRTISLAGRWRFRRRRLWRRRIHGRSRRALALVAAEPGWWRQEGAPPPPCGVMGGRA